MNFDLENKINKKQFQFPNCFSSKIETNFTKIKTIFKSIFFCHYKIIIKSIKFIIYNSSNYEINSHLI